MNENIMPQEIESMSKDLVNELDVRPILKAGKEPFGVIMKAIGETDDKGALKLRATFKPVPLFRALGSKGWSNWVEGGAGDDWTVWFYKSDDGSVNKPEAQSAELSLSRILKETPELEARLKAVDEKTWELDVNHMSPPEPMELTLWILEKLPKHIKLIQKNVRVPQFLLPILDERNFSYSIEEVPNSEEVRVHIQKKAE